MRTLANAFAALPLLAWSCTSTVTAIGDAPCVTTADCAVGYVCGFAESDGCNAEGRCFLGSIAVCEAYSPGCACDGTEITVACTGLPDGYVSKPLAHVGACAGCCAVGFDLYACTFPDAGAGLACHDPALGCASSLTCGAGCDLVVTGRCGGGT
jgi:hypothetical protein